MILPGTGRWQCQALTEGAGHEAQHCEAPPLHRFAVPLPVPGRI
ncbi:conserved hypothetical protein [Sphingomonas sp. AX6]|nr:conserved hypothetical protein [Sphingomonas sp. AX6]